MLGACEKAIWVIDEGLSIQLRIVSRFIILKRGDKKLAKTRAYESHKEIHTKHRGTEIQNIFFRLLDILIVKFKNCLVRI